MHYPVEEASTHKSAKAHAGTVFVPYNLDHWSFNPKINGFPGLIVEQFYVKFGDPSCIDFWDIVQINRHINAG